VTQAGTPGLAFGPYTALYELGRGGCATAYFGRHRETGAEVAIKVPHHHLSQDPEFRARFRREASLGALLDHPRVVKILDPGPQEGDPWLAMAFIRGTTLEAFMAGKGPLPVPQAVAIASEIAEAIAYAHGKGVVHRDLKPANVMLGEHGAVVMDFGIARMLDGATATGTMFLGTPLYCAPEGVLGAKVGPPADRYALGVMLFEMLAGHPPFEADTLYRIFEAQRFDPLPDLAGIRPHTPPRLIRLVERLCAKAPEDRPEDPETLAILGGLRPSGQPPAAVPPA
jgi:serine/threonine-protein kinase